MQTANKQTFIYADARKIYIDLFACLSHAGSSNLPGRISLSLQLESVSIEIFPNNAGTFCWFRIKLRNIFQIGNDNQLASLKSFIRKKSEISNNI